MTYTVADDPACYPNTDVLRNKANIRDANQLAEFELAMFITRSEENLPTGHFDYPHYLALHHHLFQDIYDWAGQVRKIRTGKSNHWFCYPEYIDQEMERIFEELTTHNFYKELSKNDFIIGASHFLAEINATHPFREGNGRTQMAFLILLVEGAGFIFNDKALNQKVVLSAMVESFKGNKSPLVGLLTTLVK